MRNACPSCQTVYAVTPADVGRRIVCTRCNAPLVIDDDGFRLADAGPKPPPPKPDPLPAERKRSARPDRDEDPPADDPPRPRRREPEDDDEDDPPAKASGGLGELVRKYADAPTAVFAVGVVVVLWFLFMPIIGSAKLKWYNARIDDEQLAHDTEVKRLTDAGKKESVPKAEEEWRKRKEKLERDVQWVQIGNRQSEYWDRAGTLFGFVVTALGSVGLLMAHQPTVKKIVGAVVVSAMLLLVFVTFVVRG